MTDGTVTQKPKYHCIASEHEGPMRADELRVFYGQLWCSDCWYMHSKVGKRWDELDSFADVPAAEQQPAAWARMKGGSPVDLYVSKKQAELFAGFAGGKLEPLYLHPQTAPDVAELVDALREMIDESGRASVSGNFSAAVVTQAIWALAGYRQQGGEA